jgi:hypothetical protein
MHAAMQAAVPHGQCTEPCEQAAALHRRARACRGVHMRTGDCGSRGELGFARATRPQRRPCTLRCRCGGLGRGGREAEVRIHLTHGAHALTIRRDVVHVQPAAVHACRSGHAVDDPRVIPYPTCTAPAASQRSVTPPAQPRTSRRSQRWQASGPLASRTCTAHGAVLHGASGASAAVPGLPRPGTVGCTQFWSSETPCTLYLIEVCSNFAALMAASIGWQDASHSCGTVCA